MFENFVQDLARTTNATTKIADFERECSVEIRLLSDEEIALVGGGEAVVNTI